MEIHPPGIIAKAEVRALRQRISNCPEVPACCPTRTQASHIRPTRSGQKSDLVEKVDGPNVPITPPLQSGEHGSVLENWRGCSLCLQFLSPLFHFAINLSKQIVAAFNSYPIICLQDSPQSLKWHQIPLWAT